jgi:hypothetical protein
MSNGDVGWERGGVVGEASGAAGNMRGDPMGRAGESDGAGRAGGCTGGGEYGWVYGRGEYGWGGPAAGGQACGAVPLPGTGSACQVVVPSAAQ